MGQWIFAARADIFRDDHVRPPLTNAPNKMLFQALLCLAVVVAIPACQDCIAGGLQSVFSQRKSPSAVGRAATSGDDSRICQVGLYQIGSLRSTARFIAAANDFDGRQEAIVSTLICNQL